MRKRRRKGKREGGREGEGWRKGVGRERRNAMGGKLHIDFDTALRAYCSIIAVQFKNEFSTT